MVGPRAKAKGPVGPWVEVVVDCAGLAQPENGIDGKLQQPKLFLMQGSDQRLWMVDGGHPAVLAG